MTATMRYEHFRAGTGLSADTSNVRCAPPGFSWGVDMGDAPLTFSGGAEGACKRPVSWTTWSTCVASPIDSAADREYVIVDAVPVPAGAGRPAGVAVAGADAFSVTSSV
jgi:hypothetical protein